LLVAQRMAELADVAADSLGAVLAAWVWLKAEARWAWL
jgi:VanZ family protein